MEKKTSIRSIPLGIIYEYLTNNNIPFPENKNVAYQLAEKLRDNVGNMPVALADFIIARNLDSSDIETHNLSDIIVAKEIDLLELAARLELPSVERDRIIDILNRSGKLNNDLEIFDYLPDDILEIILSRLNFTDLIYMGEMYPRADKIIQSKAFIKILDQKYQEYQQLLRQQRLELSNVTGAVIGTQFRVFVSEEAHPGMAAKKSAINRGRVCGGAQGRIISKGYLIDLMWKIGITPASDLPDVDDENRELIINKLLSERGPKQLKDKNNNPITKREFLESWADEKLDHYHKSLYGNNTVQSLCDLIQQRLEDNDRLQ